MRVDPDASLMAESFLAIQFPTEETTARSRTRPPMKAALGPGQAHRKEANKSVSAQNALLVATAQQRLLAIARYLESEGFVLGIRATAPSDAELGELLKPARPGTALNYCRLAERLQEFAAGDPVSQEAGLRLTPAFMKRWFEHLISEGVGLNTPSLAMTAWRYLADVLEFEFPGNTKAIRKICATFKQDGSHEVDRADPYTKHYLVWAEEMALGRHSQVKCNRLVCGRSRLAAGASLRQHDLKGSPVGRISWVKNPDDSIRGIVTRSGETKTIPRHWACSALGADASTDGWLEATIQLLFEAHGPGMENDDHLGKKCSTDRTTFLSSVPDPGADVCHLRSLMREHNGRLIALGEPPLFPAEEIQRLRGHGAKPTLTSLAVHLSVDFPHLPGVSRTAVRHQGAWQGKAEDIMPDIYLRASQRLSLELQETCLKHLRAGGDMLKLHTVPILMEPPQPQQADSSEDRFHTTLKELECALSDAEETVEEQPAFGAHSYTSEEEPEPDRDAAEHFLLNPSRRVYHLVNQGGEEENQEAWKQACHKRSANGCLLDAGALCRDVLSCEAWACNVCFPPPITIWDTPCSHICGRSLQSSPDSICTRRCSNMPLGGCQDGHACDRCGPAQAPATPLQSPLAPRTLDLDPGNIADLLS